MTWLLTDNEGDEIAEACDEAGIKLAARTLAEEGYELPFEIHRDGKRIAEVSRCERGAGLAYQYCGASLRAAL